MQHFPSKKKKKGNAAPKINIKARANHLCLHPRNTPVIEVMKHSLSAEDEGMELARMMLHKWGNFFTAQRRNYRAWRAPPRHWLEDYALGTGHATWPCNRKGL
jgi:hypothetical protein